MIKFLSQLLFVSFIFFSFNAIETININKPINDFSIKIKGTSNIHDWISSVEKINGEAVYSFDDRGQLSVQQCKVVIPVKSIKSNKSSIMDNKTWNALKSKSHANIEYELDRFEKVKHNGDLFTASTSGKLKIAGQTQFIQMDIKGSKLITGGIEICGTKKLKMTEFGIDPPTALMGTLTTGNEVEIDFRIIVKN